MNHKKTCRPKILFLLQLPPPTYGAAVVGQEIFDSKLINDAFETSYLNIVLARDLNNTESAFFRLIRYFGLLFKLLAILLFRRFDLCYLAITCHGVAFLKDSLFVLLCKIFCRKIVIHQHNRGMSKDAERFLYRMLYRLVYHNAKVILLSERLYDDISLHVRKEQILICPNGSPSIYDPLSPPPKKYPHHIVFLSNLIIDKGILTFLDCCSILKKAGMQFHIDIIGAETKKFDKRRLEQEIRKRSLSEISTYHGRKSGADRNRFLEEGYFFLFPTKYHNEAFPLVLLEAIQFHILCLTTPIGGIPDIIHDGKTGYICAPDDAESFANRILQIESNSSLHRVITDNAFEQYLDSFTLELFESNILQCLKKALE